MKYISTLSPRVMMLCELDILAWLRLRPITTVYNPLSYLVVMIVGCMPSPSISLDAPITLSPRGSVEAAIQIPGAYNFHIAFVFSRTSNSDERMRELIGAMGMCKIGEPCSKGIQVPVRWSLRSIDSGDIAVSGESNSIESDMWSDSDVFRRIGNFKVAPGNYVFKIDVLRDVPELTNLRTRVSIYRQLK